MNWNFHRDLKGVRVMAGGSDEKTPLCKGHGYFLEQHSL